jgi:hypothetical protein
MLKLSHAAHNSPSMRKSLPISPCLLLTPGKLFGAGSWITLRRLK